ncbi:hypothetical protein [Streptomyces sp. YIM 98790]|uniref:hypothetical protein n=1 Tax=Streptomyces sp. YIM 98790 TaxID=2689077 RepID=UPI0014072E74|nr:hypothetical protein [Streptomyces sp. YIM 98790]
MTPIESPQPDVPQPDVPWAGASPQEPAPRRSPWRRRGAMAAAVAAVATAVAVQPSFGSGGGAEPAAGGSAPESGPEMIEALTALLPAGLEVTDVEAEGSSGTEEPYVWLSADDGVPGDGLGMGLSLSRSSTEDWRADAGCAQWGEEAEDGMSCTRSELADGSILSLITWEYTAEDREPLDDAATAGDGGSGAAEETVPGGYEEPGEWPEPAVSQGWEVVLESPGGPEFENPGMRSARFSLYRDFTDEADAEGYEPPLSLDAMAGIIQEPVWQDVFRALDEKYGEPEEWVEEPTSRIPSAALGETFRALAPQGLEITGAGSPEDGLGWTSLLVDDGRGAVQVEITSWEPWQEAEGDWADESAHEYEYESEGAAEYGDAGEWIVEDCEEEETADGTWVTVCTFGPWEDDPSTSWTAGVHYPDGASLDISVLNAPDWESGPVRDDSPLTPEQLKKLVMADEWRQLFAEHSAS